MRLQGRSHLTMLRRFLLTATAAGVLFGAFVVPSEGAVSGLPPGFGTSTELSGLTRPTRIAWAPDGRRFVAEKDGILMGTLAGSSTLQQVLDLRSEVNSFQDRGLLGLAVDTNFASNGYVYLLYTYDVNRATTNPGPDDEAPTVSQLRRVTLGANNQILASQVILGTRVSGICPTPNNNTDCIPSDGTSHSIGTVISAPDGTLFVGSGDAADYNVADPLSLRTYDERSLAGKILHIDRDGRGLPGHPFCPRTAPTDPDDLTRVCAKLYAKGFRNPFRFQLLSNGALLVGDVGWASYEEINYVPAGGKSYGWPCYEGPNRTPTWKDFPECQPEYAKEGTPNAHVGPIHSYPHDYALHPSWAVVVGPEYTGDLYPAGYRGTVFWGDYGVGFLRRLRLDSTGQVASITNFATAWNESVDLTRAPNGDIAWVDLNGFGDNAGFVDRLRYTPGNANPVAVAAASPTTGTAPLTVNFNGSGSSDPDSDPLSYDWDFGDGSAHGSGAAPSHTYANGSYTATLTVSDGRGRSDTDTVQINASNTPPVPSIDAPVEGFEYRDGTAVTVTGSATDAEEPSLPASAFKWNVVLNHHDHQHLLTSQNGVKTFQMTPVRDHDADSYYTIKLTVTDGAGASVTTAREIRPDTVPLHLRSTPSGAPLSYAGTDHTAPWDGDTTIGFIGTVTAAQSFVSGGVQRTFVGWSNGASRVHDFTVPASETTLTATYNAAPVAAAAAVAPGAAPLQVNFDGSGSSDPDGDTLTYDWNFGDGSAHGTGAKPPTHTYTNPGTYTATVTVSDGRGGSDTDSVQVTATNTAPVPSIDTPTDGSKYRDGTAVSVTGSSTDAQQGSSLPASAYAWKVRLVHGAHEHVLVDTSGVKSLQFTPPTTHDADAHVVIDLTVTDGQGASGSASRQLQPETVLLRLRSNPAGAPLSYAGAVASDITAAIGFSTTVSAPATFSSGGVQRAFVGWSSGATRVHTLSVPATETTLTATYNAAPVAAASALPTSGAAPLQVDFDGSGSSDPDADTLSYDWNFGDGSAHGTGAKPPTHTYTSPGTYTATVTASDGRGGSDTDTVQVTATNTAPVPSIDTPTAGSQYRDGTAVSVTGSSTDAQQGSSLPASAYAWKVRLVHGAHEHVLVDTSGVKSLQFTPPTTHDADAHIVIDLTVTDAQGTTGTASRQLQPETVLLHLRSNPPGAPLTFAGAAVTTPWDTAATIGFSASLSAPTTFIYGGVQREFVSWSTGAPRVHSLTVPDADTTLTATYNARPAAVATASGTTATVDEELEFDGSGSSDADGDALTYTWDFGDGSAPVEEPATPHTFAAPGDYDVTLTVTDDAGATDANTVRVTVKPPVVEPPPAEPPPGGPPPDPTPPIDVTGPVFRPWRPAPHPRLIAGLVRDPAGVRSVQVALARIAAGRCRWATGAAARLARTRSCSPRHWLEAKLTGRRWELALPNGLPPGRYRLWLLAVDANGNVGRQTAEGQGQLRFRVSRAAAGPACDAPVLRRPLGCGVMAP